MNSSKLFSFYAALLMNFLSTPFAAVAILGLAVLAVLTLVTPAARWWFIAAATYAATLPVNAVGYHEGDIYIPLAFPVEQIRVYARPLSISFLLLLLLPLVTSSRGWRRELISWPLLFMFLFELGVGLRVSFASADGRGPLSLASFLLLFLAFGLGVSMWLQNLNDVYKLLYAICGAGGAVIATTCYQLLINRAPVIAGGRLAGMTGNPQFLGLVIAFTLPTACFLLLHASRFWRPLLAVQITLSIVFLIWTGSRTGMLGTVIALGVLFHRRIGLFLVVGVIVGGLLLLVLPYFEGSTTNIMRFISTENTRAGNWNAVLAQFQTHVWFGNMEEVGIVESSYIAMLGQVGLVGSAPFAVAWVLMAYKVVRLQLRRSWLGEQRQLVDLVTAYWASLAACAGFEGFLLGVLVVSVLLLYLFAALTSYLNDHIDYLQQQPPEELPQADPWQAAA